MKSPLRTMVVIISSNFTETIFNVGISWIECTNQKCALPHLSPSNVANRGCW